MGRMVVCGSRSWQDGSSIRYEIGRRVGHDGKKWTLVHGAARGADEIAARAGEAFGMAIEAHPADWQRHGRAAGFIRNVEMLSPRPDLVLAFWDGKSRGTAHTIREAERRSIPVAVIRHPAPDKETGCGDAYSPNDPRLYEGREFTPPTKQSEPGEGE